MNKNSYKKKIHQKSTVYRLLPKAVFRLLKKDSIVLLLFVIIMLFSVLFILIEINYIFK